MNDIQNPLIIFFLRGQKNWRKQRPHKHHKKSHSPTPVFFPMPSKKGDLYRVIKFFTSLELTMGLKEAFCFSSFSSYRISSSAKAAFLWVDLAILRSPSSLLLTPQSDLQCKAQLVKNAKKKETVSIHMSILKPLILSKGPLTYQFYQFSGPLTLMSALST